LVRGPNESDQRAIFAFDQRAQSSPTCLPNYVRLETVGELERTGANRAIFENPEAKHTANWIRGVGAGCSGCDYFISTFCSAELDSGERQRVST
jgi:hypothetical protein